MPFRSIAQRKYMWAKHPAIAKRWTAEHGSKIVKSNAKKSTKKGKKGSKGIKKSK